jgi:hypothetical protein
MKWIKFYTNAHEENNSIAEILDEFGTDGFGKYWLLMGLLGKKFSEDSKSITVKKRVVKDTLRFRTYNKMETFLFSNSVETVWKISSNDSEYIFDSSILLELMSRDFKKARSMRGQNARKKEKENKKEKKNNILSLKASEKTIFDDVRQSWNVICSGNGKLKPSIGLKSETTKNFFELLKLNPELKKIATWENCFEHIKSDTFLNGSNSASNFVCTLDWLIDKEKIIDVLNGQYGGNNAKVDLFALVNASEEVSNV